MRVISALLGLILIVVVLWDSFETIVLPRRVAHRLRLTALFRRTTWKLWSAPARRMPNDARRENYLAPYGPLSQLVLLALWVVTMIVGFAALQWALGSSLARPDHASNFWTDLYFSGTTFLTLGLGDVAPVSGLARLATVAEVGTGFGFLALVIAYLPVLYGAFSRREVNISLLDARAGTPPSALAMLQRCSPADDCQGAVELLRDWEQWSAELLETHLSYPVLGYFRSQHENQSWVASLTAVLDVAALVSVGVDGVSPRQGRLTFAMARHAIVDLASVFRTPPNSPPQDRLPIDGLTRLREALEDVGAPLRPGLAADRQLAELRSLYEPYAQALADHFLMPLPGWFPPPDSTDNWQTTAWGKSGVFHNL